LCAERQYTGNAAIELIKSSLCSSTPDEESWMRAVLKKHLAIGASSKTINAVFPGLVPTFDVQLAQKFEQKRVQGMSQIALEPKLDGIRCCAIVHNGKSVLYARSGKRISNFDDTIGTELAQLGDGFYDGEVMGEDFVALMRQAYRKEDVDVAKSYLSLFDFLPPEDWAAKKSTLSCAQRRMILEDRFLANKENTPHILLINREIISPDPSLIEDLHHEYVSQGYEGVMIKDLNAVYKFGRGFEVMKVKSFHNLDLEVIRIEEGTGKFSDMCGSLIVNYNGVEVGIGSGLNDHLRKKIWSAPNEYMGKIIEVRYQEMTPDGSLRFPTFVHFRDDR
jgi:DNA ligase-1